MAQKQLIEQTSSNEFYPIIELATDAETGSLELPPSLGAIKRYVDDKFVNKGNTEGQTIASSLTINNSNGLVVNKISTYSASTPLTINATLNLVGGIQTGAGNISLENTSGEGLIITSSESGEYPIQLTGNISLENGNESVELKAPKGLNISGEDNDILIRSADVLDLKGDSVYIKSDDQSFVCNFRNCQYDSENDAISFQPVASDKKLMYVNSSGVLTASNANVASSSKLMYLGNGELKVSQASRGANDKLMYLSSGEFTTSTASVANGLTFMYLEDGQFKAGTTLELTDVTLPN